MTITKRGAGYSLNGNKTELARVLNDQLRHLTRELDHGELTEIERDAYAAQRAEVRRLADDLMNLMNLTTNRTSVR